MWNVSLVTSDGHFSVPSLGCAAIKLLQDTHRSDLDPAGARSSTASFIQLARPARLSLGGWPPAPLVPPLPGDRSIPFSLMLRLEQQEGMLKESGSPPTATPVSWPKKIVQRSRPRRRLLPNLDTLCTRQIRGYSRQGRSVIMTHATAVRTTDPFRGTLCTHKLSRALAVATPKIILPQTIPTCYPRIFFKNCNSCCRDQSLSLIHI